MSELRTPDPEGHVPDRDGLRPLPLSFVAWRLQTLKVRAEEVLRAWAPTRGWAFVTVDAAGGLPLWSANMMSLCGPGCERMGCGGAHEVLIHAHGPSSLSTYRRFRDKVRRLYGQPPVEPAPRTFVRRAEDRV